MSDGQKSYIQIAAEEAKKAALRGEVPVGAVLVDGVQDKILAKDGNRMREQSNPTAHAELLVIQSGCRKLESLYLLECDLYVTLEPCPMCAQAITFARIRRLYFGAYDTKGGGVEHGARIFEQPTSHHHPEVSSCAAKETGRRRGGLGIVIAIHHVRQLHRCIGALIA